MKIHYRKYILPVMLTLFFNGSVALASENRYPVAEDSPTAIDNVTLPSDYQSWSSKEKQSYLWNERIVPSKYETLPTWTPMDYLGTGLINPLRTLSRESDELPKGRNKVFHPLGSVALVDFVPTRDSAYSGLFQGATGLVRLSWGADPKLFGYIPGAAIKFFVDGHPSRNLQVLYALEPQNSDNFFENDFSNILPEPKTLFWKTVRTSLDVLGIDLLRLNLEPFAERTQEGLEAQDTKAPYKVVFVPEPELKQNRVTGLDFREELATLKPQTTLFKVYASDAGQETLKEIGSIVTASEFIASSYGDKRLFFAHNEVAK